MQPSARFRFDDNGGISGTDADAAKTINLLKLDHTTLQGWRRGAITAFFPPDEQLSREEIERRIRALGTASNGKLAEFSFCIQSYASLLLE